MADADETELTAVKTYVPTYQKAAWKEHADRLDMSQSEFLRTMVQAGRRGFELDPAEGRSEHATPGGEGLEDRVLAILSERGALSWDELVDALSGDLEDRLDEALSRLQDENRLRYSGRDGGYVRTDGN
ncbi:DUF5805 domain-containing protein [Halegenticoccus soli]|uniref:DUF5805 domain-containing protein n=1 Tax=Halegenticoccus soli TaxID=1985678 RepID=UPI000C6EE8DD|nr:DUF5805 domain-containing protein [Halegenticoccus soli]